MKTILLTFAISFTFISSSIAQINPVQNLTWQHWYDMPHNLFILEWEEPETPHDEVIGYNIYRENDLYLFLSDETSIYNIESIYGIVSNCGGEDFLFYNDFQGFFAHVTAVYAGEVESDYIETVYIEGAMIGINEYPNVKPKIYPNPSKGIIYIENKNLDSIIIYDISGRIVREMEPKSQIDLSDITKGFYLIKLTSGTKTFVDKIILD